LTNWKKKSCPILVNVHSGRKLTEIYFKGLDPPLKPNSFFERFLDSEGWCTVETEITCSQPQNFDYASTRYVFPNFYNL